MIRWMACAAILGAAVQAQQEKPKHPPYTVTVTAKTKHTAWKKMQEFQARLKQINVYAKQVNHEGVAGDNAGWERWTFEIAGESKFDVSILQRAFGDIQCKKWELSITGTASQDPQSKIIFVTSYGGKVKVKLMNRPKKDSNPGEEVVDEVGKVSEKIAEGRQHFTVRGEIYSHGGTLAILLSEFQPAPPPPPVEKK
jgi:hypothetical protein